jgi:hypothetical protein
MSLVTSLANKVARVALIGPALTRLKRNVIRSVIGGALLIVLGATGAFFLLAALRIELEHLLGSTWAALVIGVAFFLFVGIAYLAFLRPRRSDAEEARASLRRVHDKVVRPARRFEDQLGAQPWLNLAGSLGTGFVAAFLVHLLQAKRRVPLASLRSGDGLDPAQWSREVVIHETEPRTSVEAPRRRARHNFRDEVPSERI